MNINIFFGIAIAITAIYFGAPDIRVDTRVYVQPAAFILVFLGTIGSTLTSTSFRDFKGMLQLVFSVLFAGRRHLSPVAAIDMMIDLAEVAQHVSPQLLPEKVAAIDDIYLKRSVDMVAAGLDPAFILQTLDTDIQEMKQRHQKMIGTVRVMGTYAPMFGMAGTVIGVIQVLKNVTDIDNIVSGMALALLTTLYGLFSSSILFIPFANMLRHLSEEEVLAKEILLQGTEMILNKEIPLKVEKQLTAFIHSGSKNRKKRVTSS